MLNMTMDRHAFIKTITAQGMPEPQAETLAAYVAETQLVDHDEVVTKDYLDMKLDAKLGEIKTQMSDLKNEMLKWYAANSTFQFVALVGTIVALVKFLR